MVQLGPTIVGNRLLGFDLVEIDIGKAVLVFAKRIVRYIALCTDRGLQRGVL